MRVRALTTVYIDSCYREAGAEFDYFGGPDPNLQAISAPMAPAAAASPFMTLTPPPEAGVPAPPPTPLAPVLIPVGTVPAEPPPPADTTGFTSLRPAPASGLAEFI